MELHSSRLAYMKRVPITILQHIGATHSFSSNLKAMLRLSILLCWLTRPLHLDDEQEVVEIEELGAQQPDQSGYDDNSITHQNPPK